MADKTIDSELFILYDNMPGAPDPTVYNSPPPDGFTGADHHNVATAKYPIGMKIQVYCDGSVGKEGFAIFQYLRLGTQNPDAALAAKDFCVCDSATVWYEMTNDKAGTAVNLSSGACAVALSAMTDAYYGWFWVAGVCPEQYVSGLGGNYVTASGAAAATALMLMAATAEAIAIDALTDTHGAVGWCIADDAA